jgi:hypothetical protein
MGHAKISDFNLSAVFCPKEVGRFYIPMDNSLMVHCNELRTKMEKKNENDSKEQEYGVLTIFETEHGIS